MYFRFVTIDASRLFVVNKRFPNSICPSVSGARGPVYRGGGDPFGDRPDRPPHHPHEDGRAQAHHHDRAPLRDAAGLYLVKQIVCLNSHV